MGPALRFRVAFTGNQHQPSPPGTRSPPISKQLTRRRQAQGRGRGKAQAAERRPGSLDVAQGLGDRPCPARWSLPRGLQKGGPEHFSWGVGDPAASGVGSAVPGGGSFSSKQTKFLPFILSNLFFISEEC